MSSAEVRALEERCGVTVLHMPAATPCSHVTTHSTEALGCAAGDVPGLADVTVEIQTIAPILNAICSKLWQKDQELLNYK